MQQIKAITLKFFGTKVAAPVAPVKALSEQQLRAVSGGDGGATMLPKGTW